MQKQYIIGLVATIAIMTLWIKSSQHEIEVDNIVETASADVVAETSSPTPALEPEELIKVLAKQYNIPFNEYTKTVHCESGYKHTDLYGDGGRAYGISQFHEPTFNRFLEIAISQGYPFQGFVYKSMENQLELMAWAFSQGENYKDDWTCWTKQFSQK